MQVACDQVSGAAIGMDGWEGLSEFRRGSTEAGRRASGRGREVRRRACVRGREVRRRACVRGREVRIVEGREPAACVRAFVGACVRGREVRIAKRGKPTNPLSLTELRSRKRPAVMSIKGSK